MGFKERFREWRKKRGALPFKFGPCSTYDRMLASATEEDLRKIDELLEAHKKKIEEEKKRQAQSSDQ